jgi:hypothetical protein
MVHETKWVVCGEGLGGATCGGTAEVDFVEAVAPREGVVRSELLAVLM